MPCLEGMGRNSLNVFVWPRCAGWENEGVHSILALSSSVTSVCQEPIQRQGLASTWNDAGRVALILRYYAIAMLGTQYAAIVPRLEVNLAPSVSGRFQTLCLGYDDGLVVEYNTRIVIVIKAIIYSSKFASQQRVRTPDSAAQQLFTSKTKQNTSASKYDSRRRLQKSSKLTFVHVTDLAHEPLCVALEELHVRLQARLLPIFNSR